MEEDTMRASDNSERIERESAFDEAYLKMAFCMSSLSRAVRLQVGAIIVKDGQVISEAFNGTPTGCSNVCEMLYDSIPNTTTDIASVKQAKVLWRQINEQGKGYRLSLVTKPNVIHAELNAILKLASNGGTGCKGATLYVTDSPCLSCSVHILQVGITRVVYARKYRITDGIDYLQKHGVEVIHHPID